MIERISGGVYNPQQTEKATQSGAASFGEVLQQRLSENSVQGVEFSKHAIARAQQRGIEVTDELTAQLAGTASKAQAKGATNILAFDAQRAFIINVGSMRVITAMTQDEMKENIFTNIDGAVHL